MALELCIETYGSVAPFLDGHASAALPRLRRVIGPAGQSDSAAAKTASAERRRPRALAVADRSPADELLARRVQAIATRLPFLLVQALWLVDVCGCTYRQAAEELSTTPEAIGRRVAAGRTQIRAQLLVAPVEEIEVPEPGAS